MKLNFVYIFLSIFILFSCQEKNIEIESNPDALLSKEAQQEFKYSIVRYFDKLPKKVTQDTKFETEFDSIYRMKAQNADLYHFYIHEESNEIYFAVTRIAPSIKLKKVATIGKLKKDKNDSIVFYEEICRTWKMEENELKEKVAILFEKVVKSEDISPYYTKNSQPDFYIEFPDENNRYDVVSRSWTNTSN